MTLYHSKQIKENYHNLGSGDIIVGEITAAHKNAVLLIDLMQRGVTSIPSALSQLLSRSKIAQVDILGQFMHPLTVAVKRRKDLLTAMNNYSAHGMEGPVVTKEEHMHCGHGVRKWDHIEALYSYMGLEKERYPFVLQPLVKQFVDVRVILIGDYVEAYARSNPNNFRGNLSGGGNDEPYELTPEQVRFCHKVIERGRFPFAHLDLQIMFDGSTYIFEVALNGGIQGSRLNRAEIDKRKKKRIDELIELEMN